MTKQEQINNAKEVLHQAGYYVDNLWRIEDVMDRHLCCEDTAQEILHEALTNDWVVEQIFFAINSVADDMGIEKQDDTNQ